MRIILNSKQREMRKAIVARLNDELPPDDKIGEIESYAPVVIAVLDKCPAAVWQSLDDAIGNAEKIGLERGYLVRRVRNHPIWGKKLGAVLRG